MTPDELTAATTSALASLNEEFACVLTADQVLAERRRPVG